MAGRKTLDGIEGEKRSVKFMLYITPSLLKDVRDYCDLKGVSIVSYVTDLIRSDLADKQDKIDAFRAMRENA